MAYFLPFISILYGGVVPAVGAVSSYDCPPRAGLLPLAPFGAMLAAVALDRLMERTATLTIPRVGWLVGGGLVIAAVVWNLAALHRTVAEAYGWRRDNTIGSTPQLNEWSGHWLEFLCERRIGHQLDLALRRGNKRLSQRGEELLERMGDLFTDYTPVASLLHGDLWAGNSAATPGGEPVVFDPAVYYGDREADIAMTELFGGFGPRFYAAYNEAWPLDPGYRVRKTLYNLYHIINHFNMFGGGYGGQAERMIDQLLSELH